MTSEKPLITSVAILQTHLENAWEAITNVRSMRTWFFDNIPDFEARVGFKTQFTVSTPNHDFIHQWEILKVKPQKEIHYKWEYKSFKGSSRVVFKLTPVEKHITKIKVLHYGVETFAHQGIEEFSLESCQNGWDYFIKDKLVDFF